jgi:3-dehydroquinate dehydratase-1
MGGDLDPSGRRKALSEALRAGVCGIEVRADLFGDLRGAIEVLREVGPSAPAIFTARIPAEGGRFSGTEEARIALYLTALEAGAALVDAEWGTPACEELARRGAPLIVSHHDFSAMPPSEVLDDLGRRMAGVPCRAIKLVGTARRTIDCVTILDWIGRRRDGEPLRIGFAMGEEGFPSRILAVARGSPFTYAPLGAAVAPGQVGAKEMLECYAPQRLGADCRVLGIAGSRSDGDVKPSGYNRMLRRQSIDAVCLPLRIGSIAEALEAAEPIGMTALIVGDPFGEEALAAAGEADRWSRELGAADLLEIGRSGGERRIVARSAMVGAILAVARAWRPGTRVAILGDGKQEGLAARLLLETGAAPTIYYRNLKRGTGIPEVPGVSARPAGEFDAGEFDEVLELGPHPRLCEAAAPMRGSLEYRRTLESMRKEFDTLLSKHQSTGSISKEERAAAAASLGRWLADEIMLILARADIELEALTGRPKVGRSPKGPEPA